MPPSAALRASWQVSLRNGECRTRTRGDNSVGYPHGFILHRIEIFSKKYKKVTKMIDIKNSGELREKNAEESWGLIKDLSLYDNENWNDPRDFAKPTKAISLPEDVLNASDRHLIELENKVKCLMEANLAPKYVTYNHQKNRAPPKKGIIKCPSKLLSPKYQAEPSIGNESRNSSSPKRVHFVYTITIVRKEDEPKETEPSKFDNDHHLDRNNENLVDKESKAFEIVIDEGELSDHRISDDGCEVDKEEEWVEYEEPLYLVDTNEESFYESLIEKMLSYSLNFDFRIEKGDLTYYNAIRNQGFVRTFMEITKLTLDSEQGLITFMDGVKEVTFKTLYIDFEMDDLTSEGHDLLSFRVILSEDDYSRGCERASGLESEFYRDIDKLGPSYKEEIKRIDLDVSFEASRSRRNDNGIT
uniref:MAK10-like protein n=1 Tax=Tanacetum cinerariifolium TaxID=118510 RepID=A0A6L2JGR6_TANCI|nr:hypothetical protein [Tanacetum cinerariifolium]